MTNRRGTSFKTLIYPRTQEIKPSTNCIRCGVPEQSLRRGGMANRRVPNWFHGRNDTTNTEGLSTSEARRVISEMAETELSRLQKVQEWLRLSYKYPHGMTRPWMSKRRRCQEYPTIIDGVSLGMDSTMIEDSKYPSTIIKQESLAFPDILSSEISHLQLRRNKAGKCGVNPEFTDYLTPSKSLKLRENVGPIQRPHTPRQQLGERQKALYGKQSLYRNLENNRRSTGQMIENQSKKIDSLKSDLKDLIRR